MRSRLTLLDGDGVAADDAAVEIDAGEGARGHAAVDGERNDAGAAAAGHGVADDGGDVPLAVEPAVAPLLLFASLGAVEQRGPPVKWQLVAEAVGLALVTIWS